MGIFSKIKDAIFGKDEEPQATPAPRTPTTTPSTTTTIGTPHPTAMSEVDVEASLDRRPGADKLNWRTSIVDLMKLVGLDASYAERKELAQEMGRSDYSGTAEDNIWLHQQVMNRLAANGGLVPASLRD